MGDFLEHKSWNGGYNVPLLISEKWLLIVWGVLHKAPTSLERHNLEHEFVNQLSIQTTFSDSQADYDMCVFSLLKQIVEFYNRSSSVYVCYLDASKAFDRINHWCLFNTLVELDINIIIIRLLVTFCVRWGNTYSQCFSVSLLGVRQGGIIFPILFNLYIDYLSARLNRSNIGCCLNNELVNHLMYADDTCIISPFPTLCVLNLVNMQIYMYLLSLNNEPLSNIPNCTNIWVYS